MLAVASSVACISDFAMNGIVDRLRRSSHLSTTVAHPGGDHVSPRNGEAPERLTFIRVGTMESRKMPREIVEAFTLAVDAGLEADLVFVGVPSASNDNINASVTAAIDTGYPIRWIRDATDGEVFDLVQHSSAFLSFGIEGYGIPVLEALRLGTPVIFDGIQPAAQLMAGRGCLQVSLGECFSLKTADALGKERSALDSAGVPSWTDFAQVVARQAAGMMDA